MSRANATSIIAVLIAFLSPDAVAQDRITVRFAVYGLDLATWTREKIRPRVLIEGRRVRVEDRASIYNIKLPTKSFIKLEKDGFEERSLFLPNVIRGLPKEYCSYFEVYMLKAGGRISLDQYSRELSDFVDGREPGCDRLDRLFMIVSYAGRSGFRDIEKGNAALWKYHRNTVALHWLNVATLACRRLLYVTLCLEAQRRWKELHPFSREILKTHRLPKGTVEYQSRLTRDALRMLKPKRKVFDAYLTRRPVPSALFNFRSRVYQGRI